MKDELLGRDEMYLVVKKKRVSRSCALRRRSYDNYLKHINATPHVGHVPWPLACTQRRD